MSTSGGGGAGGSEVVALIGSMLNAVLALYDQPEPQTSLADVSARLDDLIHSRRSETP